MSTGSPASRSLRSRSHDAPTRSPNFFFRPRWEPVRRLREHELELAPLGQGNLDDRPRNREDRAKAPKLPSFVDGKDDLYAYLQRFERFSDTAKWEKTGWASKLSALLSGQALEVYSCLSEEAAKDYDKVKIALMKRYDLTEDAYRRKFKASKPEVDESPDQFIVRLDRYLLW